MKKKFEEMPNNVHSSSNNSNLLSKDKKFLKFNNSNSINMYNRNNGNFEGLKLDNSKPNPLPRRLIGSMNSSKFSKKKN